MSAPVAALLLSDLVLRLLGVPNSANGHLDKARFFLAGPWPRWSAVLIVVLGALWFGYTYYRDGTRPSLATKIPLYILRLIALASLAVMLLQPMLLMEKSDTIRSNAIVLVDDSLSMGFRDDRLPADRADRTARAIGVRPTDLTRAQVVERMANDPRVNLIGTLSKKYSVRLYRFGSAPELMPLPTDPRQLRAFPLRVTPNETRGNSTQIGAALKRALDDVAGQQVAGAIVLSDGGNNLGEDPVAVAEQAKLQSVRVSTLGIGDPTPTKDLAVTEVLADQVVRKDNMVQVFAGIANRGYAGKTVNIVLRRGIEQIGRQAVKLGTDAQKQTVTFNFIPKQEGSFTYSVAADVLPDEVTPKNNRRQFLQRVTSKKLKILFVEGEPRWEYRYLKNAVLRDTQIQFSCILTSSTFKTGGEGNVPIFSFPSDEKSLFDFDILILGDVPKGYFSDAQIRNIRRFVEDKGGSLIAIAGEKHMPAEYRGSSLDGVFPVVLPLVPEQVKTDEPFHWELTEAGRRDPVLRLSEDSALNAQAWRELPGMNWNAGVERAKPGATVLAVNSDRSNAYGKRVLVAVQSFGAGRCYMSLVDSTWRWRWRVGDRYFYRYWGQVLRTLTPHEAAGGNRFAQVNADRAEYMIGDRVSFHARLLDSFYRPIKERSVAATLKGETGPPVQITLAAVPGSPGLYSAEALADRTGKFELSLASPANPSAKAAAVYLVQAVALENQQPEMNEALLKKIAASGGGNYYFPDELKRWIDSLKANDLTVRSESEIELWDAPLFLLLFIIALTIEWIVRKRTGLL